MAIPARLAPLLEQFDFGRQRLRDRIAGPEGDSGDGVLIEIPAMTDEELPLGTGAALPVDQAAGGRAGTRGDRPRRRGRLGP